MKRLLSRFVVLVAMVALVAFALANRQVIRVNFDPLTPDTPWLALDVPLWLAMFAAILVGLLAGWIAAWINHGRYRRAAREARAELKSAQSHTAGPPAVVQ
ncbi:MAG: lipopolysaccharide assembly protein LapA domain-containing protein [Hyphomicrobiales bacterium]